MIIVYKNIGYNLANYDTFYYCKGLGAFPSRIALFKDSVEAEYISVDDEKEGRFVMAKIERQATNCDRL